MKFRSKRSQRIENSQLDTDETIDYSAEEPESFSADEAADISISSEQPSTQEVIYENKGKRSKKKGETLDTDQGSSSERIGYTPVQPTYERVFSIPDADANHPSILLLARLFVALVLIIIPKAVSIPDNYVIFFNIFGALIAGYDIVISAVKDIIEKVYLRENIPLIIAVLCSFAIGRGFEGTVAVLILQLSYILRGILVRRIKKLLLSDVTLPPTDKGFNIGDTLTVTEGSLVPVDCTVADGRGMVDCSFITGDVAPVQFKPGDYIPAGCVCLSGQLMLRVETLPDSSAQAKLGRMIDSGFHNVTETESRITSASRYITPAMLLISIVLLIVFTVSKSLVFTDALGRVITILAIASPCAALLSVPMTYFEFLVNARRKGIVFRDSELLDKTAATRIVIFDKAGTVTTGSYSVAEIFSDKLDPVMFLKVAAHAASVSDDPVAKAIVAAYGENIDSALVKDFVEFKGRGVSVFVDGISILLGNTQLMNENNVVLPKDKSAAGTTVYMSVQNLYAGRIVLRDSVNPDIAETVSDLHAAGVDRVTMISADTRERDSVVAREAGITEYYSECSTDEMSRRIKDIRSRAPADNAIAYVCCGGRNDEACRTADISVLLKGMENRCLGADADVVILGKAITAIPHVVSCAAKTRKTAWLKFFAAALFKLLIVILAATGIAPLWFGLTLDNLVSLALILDFGRIFHSKKDSEISADNA